MLGTEYYPIIYTCNDCEWRAERPVGTATFPEDLPTAETDPAIIQLSETDKAWYRHHMNLGNEAS